MAGDWIKMRADLFTHPKVVRISSALKADVLRTVGGLMSAWCLFDAHSVDGRLDGYSEKTLDDHLRWPGFSAAMRAVDWLAGDEQGIVLPRFDTHNGASAKRRAQDADRKNSVRKVSASQADKMRTREEKRREEKKDQKKEPAADRRVTFRGWIASLPEGADAIPASHNVFAYADRAGIPAEFLDLAWIAFERRYAQADKRYTDWPAVYRKAVEGNWLKLWYIDGASSEYRLTTAGLQLQRESKS